MNRKDYAFEPIKTLHYGNIEASIWEADGNGPDRFSVKIARLYWEKDEWKYSILFRDEELLILSKIASDAYSWIRDHECEGGAGYRQRQTAKDTYHIFSK